MENSGMPTAEKRSKKPLLKVILALVFAGIGYWAISKFIYVRHHEETDDAQLEADISPVIARAGGYIRSVRFEENQKVHAGDTLVLIDDSDYRIKVHQAEAAVAAAEAAAGVASAGVETAQANLRSAQAGAETTKVRVWSADKEFTRISNLQKQGAGTERQFDAAKAEKDAADAQLAIDNRHIDAALAAVNAAKEQLNVAAANVSLRRTDVDYARLQLSYTVVTAPADGIASRKNMQLGQLVNQGASLFAVVADSNAYIVANFKETQIGKMLKGQAVEVKVDAFPGKIFNGTVYSFSPATGAKFSLLPPDNATGNYVKVVQRVPVRIRLENSQDGEILRPGMSVHVSVKIDG